MAQEEFMDAQQAIDHFNKQRERLSLALDWYKEYLNEDRPTVEVGGFYQTLNGSTVYVARTEDDETAKDPFLEQIEQMMQSMVGGQGSIYKITPERADDEGENDPDEEDSDTGFVTVVLTGGHGFDGFMAAQPGDAYIVNDQGLFTDLKVSHDIGHISTLDLGLIGMSLYKKFPVEFKKQE